METQVHPLESYFHELVQQTFEQKLGMTDPDITSYLSRMLCDFSEPDNVFRLHDAQGKRIEDLNEMALAADPVYGTASSFDEEREVRRYMGDYALFIAGMCHDVVKPATDAKTDGPTLAELIEAGKQSYYIVSQFNVFEHQQEAPMFAQLSEDFERCLLGLALVREQLNDQHFTALPQV